MPTRENFGPWPLSPRCCIFSTNELEGFISSSDVGHLLGRASLSLRSAVRFCFYPVNL